jgi:hypothetical protein
VEVSLANIAPITLKQKPSNTLNSMYPHVVVLTEVASTVREKYV